MIVDVRRAAKHQRRWWRRVSAGGRRSTLRWAHDRRAQCRGRSAPGPSACSPTKRIRCCGSASRSTARTRDCPTVWSRSWRHGSSSTATHSILISQGCPTRPFAPTAQSERGWQIVSPTKWAPVHRRVRLAYREHRDRPGAIRPSGIQLRSGVGLHTAVRRGRGRRT